MAGARLSAQPRRAASASHTLPLAAATRGGQHRRLRALLFGHAGDS